jgi:hypothetical protein
VVTREKDQDIDEMTLEKLWGEEVTKLSPEVRVIITSALRKVRQRREQQQDFPNSKSPLLIVMM